MGRQIIEQKRDQIERPTNESKTLSSLLKKRNSDRIKHTVQGEDGSVRSFVLIEQGMSTQNDRNRAGAYRWLSRGDRVRRGSFVFKGRDASDCSVSDGKWGELRCRY